jgi:DNA-binding NtrC family response regulator
LNSDPEIRRIDLPEQTADEHDHMDWFPRIPDGAIPEQFELRAAIANWERSILEQILLKTRGSKSEAARRLGLSKSDLSYKLSKYGLA